MTPVANYNSQTPPLCLWRGTHFISRRNTNRSRYAIYASYHFCWCTGIDFYQRTFFLSSYSRRKIGTQHIENQHAVTFQSSKISLNRTQPNAISRPRLKLSLEGSTPLSQNPKRKHRSGYLWRKRQVIDQHTQKEQSVVNPTFDFNFAIESAYSTDITRAYIHNIYDG